MMRDKDTLRNDVEPVILPIWHYDRHDHPDPDPEPGTTAKEKETRNQAFDAEQIFVMRRVRRMAA